MANPKTVTKDIVKAPVLDIARFKDWGAEQVGFAPYFEPEVGAAFVAYIDQADMKDPNFLRYLFQASTDVVPCRRGPKPPEPEDAKEGDDSWDTRPRVNVAPGGFFSLSLFFSMVENLNTYLLYKAETGEPVEVFIQFLGKSKTKSGRTVWNVDMKIPKELQEKMNAFRTQLNGGGGKPMLPPKPKAGESKEQFAERVAEQTGGN